MRTVDHLLSSESSTTSASTFYGQAVYPTNTNRQHPLKAAGVATPAPCPGLAQVAGDGATIPARSGQYYPVRGLDSKVDRKEIPFTSESSLPLAQFQVPRRWHKVPLFPAPRLLLFAPSVQPPPIEKFVPRPSRIPLVELWKSGDCDWQKRAKAVPPLEYRDVGYSWRWPRPGEFVTGMLGWLGVKRGKA